MPASGTSLDIFWQVSNGFSQLRHKCHFLRRRNSFQSHSRDGQLWPKFHPVFRATLTWLPGTLMCAIKSLMAVRSSCRSRCGALCSSWPISTDSSRELRACSHCHSSLRQHTGTYAAVLVFLSTFTLTCFGWFVMLTLTRGCCPESCCGTAHLGASGAPALWSAPRTYTVSGSPSISLEIILSCFVCGRPASPSEDKRTPWSCLWGYTAICSWLLIFLHHNIPLNDSDFMFCCY